MLVSFITTLCLCQQMWQHHVFVSIHCLYHGAMSVSLSCVCITTLPLCQCQCCVTTSLTCFCACVTTLHLGHHQHHASVHASLTCASSASVSCITDLGVVVTVAVLDCDVASCRMAFSVAGSSVCPLTNDSLRSPV